MLVRRGGSGPAAPRTGHFRNVMHAGALRTVYTLNRRCARSLKVALTCREPDYCPNIGFSFVNINGTLPAAGWVSRLILPRILRAFLKRAPPSFTVEIRRQQKRTAMGVNPGWIQTKLAHSTFGGEPRRVASPAPEIRKVDAPAAEAAAPRPSGRPPMMRHRHLGSKLQGARHSEAVTLSTGRAYIDAAFLSLRRTKQ